MQEVRLETHLPLQPQAPGREVIPRYQPQVQTTDTEPVHLIFETITLL